MKLFVKIFYVYAALFYSKGCSLWAIGAITSYGPQPNRSRSMTVSKVSRLGEDQRPNPYRSRSRGNGRRSKLSEDNHDSKRKNQCTGIYNPSGDKPSAANIQKPDQDHTV